MKLSSRGRKKKAGRFCVKSTRLQAPGRESIAFQLMNMHQFFTLRVQPEEPLTIVTPVGMSRS